MGDFSSKDLQSIKLKDAVGRNIICEDGITRLCHEIVNSFTYPWRAIVNEKDPDSSSGYFVNLHSLGAQIAGAKLPSSAEAASWVKAVQTKYGIPETGISLNGKHPLDA